MSDSKGTNVGVVMLRDVRLSFTRALFEAHAAQTGAKPKFNVGVIIPKGSENEKKVRAALTEVAKAKWGAKASEIYNALKASDKLALHDGDGKPNVQGYPGNFYINASSDQRPTVIDRNKSPLTAADGRPYSGCYANVEVSFWAQDNNFGKRINASLMGVQFVRDGERFAGGAVASVDDFETIPDTEGGAAPATEIFD